MESPSRSTSSSDSVKAPGRSSNNSSSSEARISSGEMSLVCDSSSVWDGGRSFSQQHLHQLQKQR